MNENICVVYTHSKLGDLIWQLPYIKALSEYHKKKITIIVRASTQAKKILKDLDHFDNIEYNNFRKGVYYWIDTYKLYSFLKQKNFSHLYVLDKVSRPAIAAKFAKIKNIIGPGIGNQKKWLTVNKYLSKEDWKLNYSEQSQKILNINSITINNIYPEIYVDIKRFREGNSDLEIEGKKIAFGIDSFEDYKMWYEEDFVKLADKLYEKNLFDYIYLICGKEKSYLAKNIKKLSNKDYFIDCSEKNLNGIIFALKNSKFLVGNNSGPINLAAALNIKSFGLIANDPIDELKYSKIQIITPENYNNIRCREREGMKKLKVEQVFNKIMEGLN